MLFGVYKRWMSQGISKRNTRESPSVSWFPSFRDIGLWLPVFGTFPLETDTRWSFRLLSSTCKTELAVLILCLFSRHFLVQPADSFCFGDQITQTASNE